MKVDFLLLFNRQCKIRMAKFYSECSLKDRARLQRELTLLITTRRSRQCSFIEYEGKLIVYRRYASLFFAVAIAPDANPLLALDWIHRLVEILDRYFGNVCELDLVFNFPKAYAVLDELIVGGRLIETSAKACIRNLSEMDEAEKQAA